MALFGNSNNNSGGLFGSNSNNNNNSGGLSGNKSNNSGGLFGNNNNNNNNSGGLFGNKSNNNNSGGLFGNNNNNNNSSGGLIGNNNNNNSGGGLFGNKSNNSSGGLIGNNNNNNSGGGLFGNKNNNSNNSGGGGLFGNKSNNSGGGLFGNNNNNNSGGGLLGNKSNNSGGLFGSNNNSNNSGGLFGSNNNNSGGLLNNNNNNNAVSLSIGSKQFSELPQNLQSTLKQLDSEIVKYSEKSSQIEKILQGLTTDHKPDSQVNFMCDELGVLKRQIDSSRESIKPTEKKLHSSLSSAREMRLQLQRGTSLMNLPPDIYWAALENYDQELSHINKMQAQIKRHTSTLASTANSHDVSVKKVVDGIQAQYQALVVTADRASGIHNKVEGLRQKRKANLALTAPSAGIGR